MQAAEVSWKCWDDCKHIQTHTHLNNVKYVLINTTKDKDFLEDDMLRLHLQSLMEFLVV